MLSGFFDTYRPVPQATEFGGLESIYSGRDPRGDADEVGGSINRRIALAIFTLSISVCCYAQRDTGRRWTDKNNAEQYAAYMIQSSYYERGYMGVRVQVRDDGERKVFEVVPGRVYHIKAMQILPQNDLPTEAMSTAPTVGDVYSADRMNDWIATLKNRYNRAANWGMRLDRANADATVEVQLDGVMPASK